MSETVYRKMVRMYINELKGDMTYKQIADLTGQSPQNLHGKIEKGSLSMWEFLKILDAVGLQMSFQNPE